LWYAADTKAENRLIFFEPLVYFYQHKFFFIDTGGIIMERIATLSGEWGGAKASSEHSDGMASKVLSEVLGIIKDTLVMSVVVMAGTALTMLLW
jgi:hypothetical protein